MKPEERQEFFRRLQARGRKQHWPAGVDVTFVIEWPYLGHGGIPALRECIQRDGYSLVIVDTLTRALGGADQMDLAETALILGELQRLAQDLDVTILLIDHHRKPNGLNPDPVDDLLGSTGKAQPLDGICGLYRERGKKEARLRITGRDVEEAYGPKEFLRLYLAMVVFASVVWNVHKYSWNDRDWMESRSRAWGDGVTSRRGGRSLAATGLSSCASCCPLASPNTRRSAWAGCSKKRYARPARNSGACQGSVRNRLQRLPSPPNAPP